MGKIKFIVFLGLLTAVTPYLGIAGGFKNFVFIGGGILTAFLAYLAGRQWAAEAAAPISRTFSDSPNNPPTQDEPPLRQNS